MHMIRKGQIRWLPRGDTVGHVRFVNQFFGLAVLTRLPCLIQLGHLYLFATEPLGASRTLRSGLPRCAFAGGDFAASGRTRRPKYTIRRLSAGL
jgi:hypothetical protein